MKSIFVLGLVVLGSTAVAHAESCANVAEGLARDVYTQEAGDPMGKGTVKTIEARDGSTWYKVTEGKKNPEDGPITYDVWFDDPNGCSTDTAHVERSKKQ